jgi:hypothetical protein
MAKWQAGSDPAGEAGRAVDTELDPLRQVLGQWWPVKDCELKDEIAKLRREGRQLTAIKGLIHHGIKQKRRLQRGPPPAPANCYRELANRPGHHHLGCPWREPEYPSDIGELQASAEP